MVVDFVNSNKDDVVEGRKIGVELICRVLQVVPSTYCGARDHAPSARILSDTVLSGELFSLREASQKVYGVRKIWKAARHAQMEIVRDQTPRLMRFLGIEGVKRSSRAKTTNPDRTAARHPDLVKRVFWSSAPNQLWVTDLTFVPTWAGVA